jgi:hypothetical protein
VRDAVETLHERFRRPITSWGTLLHRDYNLSRSRLVGLSEQVVPVARPPATLGTMAPINYPCRQRVSVI